MNEKIELGIFYSIENGKKTYDWDAIAEEFESKINETLKIGISVGICELEDTGDN